MSDDPPIIEYRTPKYEPTPFRPGLRVLSSVAFAAAFWLLFQSVIIATMLHIPMFRMWTLYAAVLLIPCGMLLFKLAYRKGPDGAG